MKTLKFLTIALFSSMLFVSCSDDDTPQVVNEEEVITTLRLTLTPDGGGTPVVFQSQDLDGDGPLAPTVSVSADLLSNTTYSGVVEVLNELESPAEDITLEVIEEGYEHQFFYTFDQSPNLAVNYDDMDSNGNPIGQQIQLVTAAAESNKLTVILRHEPNKTAEGVANGDITNAGGETDVQVTFDFNVVD